MDTVTAGREAIEILDRVRTAGRAVALVPTMGALHAGHMSLARIAKDRGCFTVLSIFVNPLQFDDPDDLKRYPSALESDAALAERHGVDLLLVPSAAEIYPEGAAVTVRAGSFAAGYEGSFRPGHFDAVVTVVSKLFRLVEPRIAVFGEKDYQQLLVIRQMTESLHLPVEIVAGPLLRDPDGLAMSSRNLRLTPETRAQARRIPSALNDARNRAAAGECSAARIQNRVMNLLQADPALKVDYVAVVDQRTLQEVSEITQHSRILLAAYVEGVRLIDTVSFGSGDSLASAGSVGPTGGK